MSMTFRVFVSSTFSDLKEERDALQTRVFKPLREFCAQYGARFQAIDLRWGVSEEASRDQQTMNICLSEIKRCQQVTPRPNFVILLGERYGWCPPPPQIPADEFRAVYKKSSKEGQEIIAQWYRCDHNAVPPEYILQPWDEYNYEEWGQIERKLHDALLSGARAAGLDQDAMFKYWASATHQEIAAGALSESAEPENVFAFNRKINRLPDDETARDYLDCNPEGNPDTEAQTYLNALKSELDEVLADNVKRYKTDWISNKPQLDYIDRLCDDMMKSLKGVIEDQLSELEEVDSLELEVAEHKSFGEERARSFIGRQSILEKIDAYITGQDHHPVAIWGESGSGKSALLGKAVSNAKKVYQDAEIIYHFIGATPESSNGRSLLESLCRQISRHYDAVESDIPIEFNDLVQDFLERMSLATEDKPLIIFIDALDQLGEMDNAQALAWIPTELPENVRLVVSTLPGTCLDALKTKLPDSYLVELQPLSSDHGNDLLDIWLSEAGRKLQPEQRKELMNKFNTNRLPLYLKLAFEEARRWKSYSPLCKIKPDIPGVIQDMFDRLSRDANHGKVLFSHALSYIAAAKNGLSEDETLDVLSQDDDVMADFFRRSPKSPHVERLPVVVWSRLYTDLEPYLSQRSADGTSLISFYHPTTFGKAVRETYLREEVKDKRHHALASYFEQQPLSIGEDDEKEFNLRKLSELPFQQTCGYMKKEIEATLTDFNFLRTKIRVVGLQDLISDFEEVSNAAINLQSIKLLQDALLLSSHALILDPLQVASQLVARLSSFDNPAIRALLSQINSWDQPWIHPLTSRFVKPGSPLVRTISGHTDAVRSVTISSNGQHVISGSQDKSVKIWEINSGSLIANLSDHNNGINDVAVSSDDTRLVCAAQNDIAWWDLKTKTKFATLYGHEKSIKDVAISSDGCIVASVSSDKTLRIWDLEVGVETLRIEADFFPFEAVVICADNKRVITASENQTIKVWDIETGKLLMSLKGHKTRIIALAVSSDDNILVSGSISGRIRIWALETGSEIGVLTGHNAGVRKVLFSPDNNYVISASSDGKIKLWDLKTRNEIAGIKGHGSAITDVDITPDGKRIISASADKTLKVWDIELLYQAQRFQGHMDEICSITITSKQSRAISASKDGTLKVWDLKTGDLIATLSGHSKEVNYMKVSPDQKTLISASKENILKVWDLKTYTEITTLEGHTKQISDIKVTSDGSLVISASYDRTIKVWNLKSGSEIATLSGHQGVVKDLALTQDDHWIISSSGDKTLKIWDLKTMSLLTTLVGHTQPVGPVEITPDGRKIISGSLDEKLIVWDIETGNILAKLHGNGSKISEIAITPDNRWVVSRSQDQNIILWALDKILKFPNFSGHADAVFSLALTPDGQNIVSASKDQTLKMWDINYGKEIHTFEGHEGWVTTVAVTPDGKHAVSGSKDKTLRIWDLDTGGELDTVTGHTHKVRKVKITPDGNKIISTAWTTIKVWDFESRQEIGILEGHKDLIYDIAVHPNGKFLVSASHDKTIKIWDINTGSIVHTLTGHTKRVTSVELIPERNEIVSASWDKTIRLWDIQTGAQKKILIPEENWGRNFRINTLAVTPDRQYLIASLDDRKLHIWDFVTGNKLATFSMQFGETHDLVITPDCNRVFSCSSNQYISGWGLQSWQTLIGHKNSPLRIIVSYDGKYLLSSGEDQTLRVWNLNQSKMMTSFTGDGDFIDFDISVDENMLAVGDRLGYVNLFNFKNLDLKEPLITSFENSVICIFCKYRFSVHSNDRGKIISCPECGNKLHINQFERKSFDLSKTMIRHRHPLKKDTKKQEHDLFSDLPKHLRPKEATSENIDQIIRENKKEKMNDLQRQIAKKSKKPQKEFKTKIIKPQRPKKLTAKDLSSKQIQTRFDNLSKIDNFMKGVSKKNKTSKPSNMFDINKPKPPAGSIIESMKKSKGKPKKKPTPKKKPKDKNDSEDDKNED